MNNIPDFEGLLEVIHPFVMPEIYYQREALILGIDADEEVVNGGGFLPIERSILPITEAIYIYKDFIEQSYQMNAQWPEALFPVCDNNSQFLFIILHKDKSVVSPVYFLDVGAGDTLLEYYAHSLLDIVENKKGIDRYLTDYDILKPETLPKSWFKSA